MEAFREKFNLEAYNSINPGEEDGPWEKKMNSKQFSEKRYFQYVDILQELKHIKENVAKEDEKKKAKSLLKKKFGTTIYRLPKEKYRLVTVPSAKQDDDDSQQSKTTILAVAEKRVVLRAKEMFDVILECHQEVGHGKVGRTFLVANKRYHNVTKEMIQIFCDTCPVCSKKTPWIGKKPGATTPIRSSKFRDRFQVDLIDYRSNPQQDHNGVTMRWIMTLKDHSTRFVYLQPLQNKEAVHVAAAEFEHICCAIGFPMIYHSDNGGEVQGNVILQMLKDNNPNVVTVTGRPRTPSDQGSVERANDVVKKTLASIMAQATQAAKMIRHRANHINVCRGDIVCIKVDPRDKRSDMSPCTGNTFFTILGPYWASAVIKY